MSGSGINVELRSVDDLFSTEESRQDAAREKVMEIALSELYPFPDHPFSIREDDSMKETVESIKEYGVLSPAIARPRADGGYEIISGHRRKRACELAGLETMPVIVRDLDTDTATIFMVDSNLQRENILPMEKAKAYKMKIEAINRKAGRPLNAPENEAAENCGQLGHNFRGTKTRDIVAEGSDDSARTIQRYVRLNKLSPALQQMVDEKKIAVTPAVELSYLKPEEQALVVETIASEQATPSLSQAQRMKKLSQTGGLNEDTMLSIMTEEKKPPKEDLTIPGETLRKYFPRSFTPRQMEDTISKLLASWCKKRQKSQER